MNIIGRKEEIKELEQLYNSDGSEFVAVYGRRRVGKTFLIKEVFKDLSSFGLKQNEYSGQVQNVITLDDLFS